MSNARFRRRKHSVFLDVDQTILGPDGSLRPHTMELLEQLRSARRRVYLWSAAGGRQDVIERFGLRAHTAGTFKKPFPLAERPAAVLLTRLRRRFGAVICIDDDPEVIRAFGGVLVKPYTGSPDDDGLLDALAALAGHGWRDAQPLRQLLPWRSLAPRLAAIGTAAFAGIFGLIQVLLPAGLAVQPLLQPRTVFASLITDCNGNDWAGANLTIDTTNSKLGGNHYNIGTFTVNTAITLLVCTVADGGDGTLTIGASSVVVTGIIDGNGLGAAGGAGGAAATGTAGTGGCISTIESCPGQNGGGPGTKSGTDAGGGGGGGYVAGGAGGGADAATGGAAGGAYGATTDSLIQKGSGGGGGGAADAGEVGGAGGAGGASIRLITNRSTGTITGAGTVRANGAAGTAGTSVSSAEGGGGGGSGGGVYMRAATLNMTGTITVNGGTGGAGSNQGGDDAGGGGGGGGGRIKCHAVTITACGSTSRTATLGSGGAAAGNGGVAGTAGSTGTITDTAEANPTAVTVGSVSVERMAAGDIQLSWKSSSEYQTIGYNLYRRDRPDLNDERVRVNQQVIPAEAAGSPVGSSYVYIDGSALRSIDADLLTDYFIEELYATGRSEMYGPFAFEGEGQSPAAAGTALSSPPLALFRREGEYAPA